MKNQKYINQGRVENQYCCPDKIIVQLCPRVYFKLGANFNTLDFSRKNLQGRDSNGYRLFIRANDQEMKASLYKHKTGGVFLHHEIIFNGFEWARKHFDVPDKYIGMDGYTNFLPHDYPIEQGI